MKKEQEKREGKKKANKVQKMKLYNTQQTMQRVKGKTLSELSADDSDDIQQAIYAANSDSDAISINEAVDRAYKAPV